MRILYFALDCPLPANNGLRQRTWTVLRALRAEGCQITLVCLQSSESAALPAHVKQVCDGFWSIGHRAASLSQRGDWSRRLGALAARQPYAVRRFRSTAARALLERVWAGGGWDALICDTVYATVNLPAAIQPLVLNHHNIEHRLFDSYAAQETRAWRQAAARWEGRRVQRYEIEVGRRTALNLVCSEVDRLHLLEQQPEALVHVVPNIAPEAGAPAPVEPEPDLVVFQGALDWLPNRDAMDFFLTAIWPQVLAEHPTARLQVVGRNPPAAFLARHRGRPRVEFTGTVAEVRPYLARAAVAIAPLRMGSGTRLKILEAAAMARAIVATPIGAEGLHFLPGVEIEIAASAAGFAAQVNALLRSPSRRYALGAAALARVEADYSFTALRRSLREALQAVAPAAASEAALNPALVFQAS
ncbi:MAG: glycosyltransferase [Terriglobales bacterium]